MSVTLLKSIWIRFIAVKFPKTLWILAKKYTIWHNLSLVNISPIFMNFSISTLSQNVAEILLKYTFVDRFWP